MVSTNPALGVLGALPRELRNIIYVYAAAPRDYEVSIHSQCKIVNPVSEVSRITRAESTEACKKLVGQGCHHEKFTHALPPPGYSDGSILLLDNDGNFKANNTGTQHNLSNTKQLRFITHHLGNDVPTAVVLDFDLPKTATFEIYGASAWTEKAVTDALKVETLAIVQEARHPTILGIPITGPRDRVKAREIERLAVAVRNAVCRKSVDGDDEDGYYAVN